MKTLSIIVLVFCSLALNAQTIHTFYIDSIHTTSNWPPPPAPTQTDTTFVINNGDVICFINKLHSTMFNVWIDDPDLTGSPTYGTVPISTNDTIFKIEVINDTTYFINGWTTIYFLPDIVFLNGSADWGRRYFITNNGTSSIAEPDFSNNILIYPIPVNSTLNFKGILGNESKFCIFDLSGKLIKEDNLTGNSIDVEELQTGIYFLKISINGTDVRNYKFVKK